MAAPAIRSGSKAVRANAAAWASSFKGASMAEKLDERHNAAVELERVTKEAEAELHRLTKRPRQDNFKTFAFHVGADLQIPTDDRRKTHEIDAEYSSATAQNSDPFAGLPLRAWAERMGERIVPAYELIKEEQRKSKLNAKKMVLPEPSVPSIPHLLPITRWAAKSESFKATFIAENGKDRKKARLSWYHPDDTMVPRDWFRGGLLADLKYYSPFAAFNEAKPSSA